MNYLQAEKIASIIELQCIEMHQDRRSWNKLYGQWLVYGFEKYFGFIDAADLCAKVERAYKAKKCVKTAALEFLILFYNIPALSPSEAKNLNEKILQR